MTETIISHLAKQAHLIDAKINALEKETIKTTTREHESIVWGNTYFQRSNTLHDSLDAQTDAIAVHPAEDHNDVIIQLKIALQTLRIVNDSDTASPMTEKVEMLVENALSGLTSVFQN